ncbi:MAG: hypothetical protein V1647_02015, partial [Pseudomonadota bacterium]
DFAQGVADIHTSFEMFLYQLTFKQVEELVDSGKKIEKNNPKFKDCPEILKLVEKINSVDKIEISLILDGISNNFRVKDCMRLLEVIEGVDIKNFHSCIDLQRKRNDIVHRGKMADFEDYANAFIIIGNLFNIYKID